MGENISRLPQLGTKSSKDFPVSGKGSRRFFPSGSSISRTLSLVRKQKILPQWIKHIKNTILSKEVENSSSMVQAHQASSP